jgi:hypothetical protein
MKKQAKELQEKLAVMQNELKNLEIEGVSENNLVKITMNGEKKIKKIKIDPKCIDPNDTEGLEDLIISAYNNAFSQIEEKSASSMNDFKGLMPF